MWVIACVCEQGEQRKNVKWKRAQFLHVCAAQPASAAAAADARGECTDDRDSAAEKRNPSSAAQ